MNDNDGCVFCIVRYLFEAQSLVLEAHLKYPEQREWAINNFKMAEKKAMDLTPYISGLIMAERVKYTAGNYVPNIIDLIEALLDVYCPEA